MGENAINLNIRFRTSVLDMFFGDAIPVSEIAFRLNEPERTVQEILRTEQTSGNRTEISPKFKRAVAAFALRNKQASVANIARHFFLKDERGLRDWVKEYGSEPKQDMQGNLLAAPDWKRLYLEQKASNEALEQDLRDIRAKMKAVLEQYD